MRRRVCVDSQALGFESGADHRLGRTLAVGAGDMDHRGQSAMRVPDRRQATVHAVQVQVDDFWMQALHSFEYCVRRRESHQGGLVAKVRHFSHAAIRTPLPVPI